MQMFFFFPQSLVRTSVWVSFCKKLQMWSFLGFPRNTGNKWFWISIYCLSSVVELLSSILNLTNEPLFDHSRDHQFNLSYFVSWFKYFIFLRLEYSMSISLYYAGFLRRKRANSRLLLYELPFWWKLAALTLCLWCSDPWSFSQVSTVSVSVKCRLSSTI